jgi:hypothetical protein
MNNWGWNGGFWLYVSWNGGFGCGIGWNGFGWGMNNGAGMVVLVLAGTILWYTRCYNNWGNTRIIDHFPITLQ